MQVIGRSRALQKFFDLADISRLRLGDLVRQRDDLRPGQKETGRRLRSPPRTQGQRQWGGRIVLSLVFRVLVPMLCDVSLDKSPVDTIAREILHLLAKCMASFQYT